MGPLVEGHPPQESPVPKICHTYPTKMKFGRVIPYLKKTQNMVTIFMMSAKLATPGLLKIKMLRNKAYDVIILDNEFISKVLLRDSIYIVDVIM